jgi:pSer/pThr/pTyr-binding forkhead associated (FHA) protein
VALCLVVLDGPDQGKRFELAGALVLGRDRSAGIVIDDPDVSRRHVFIALGGNKLELEDLESKNGTWVAGERIKDRRRLGEGEKFRVGNTVLKVARAPAATRIRRQPDVDDRQVTKPSDTRTGRSSEARPR